MGSKYIGIRVPDSNDVCEMINNIGEPMLVSSANKSDEPVCKNYEEVYNIFNDKVAIIVEGKTKSNVPSTIIICDDKLELVREGGLPFELIKREWEKEK
jgi:tRNA A37 threonylcarbamoyladenosine synthetase subunit TsaC/SUA5/YrdC